MVNTIKDRRELSKLKRIILCRLKEVKLPTTAKGFRTRYFENTQ